MIDIFDLKGVTRREGKKTLQKKKTVKKWCRFQNN